MSSFTPDPAQLKKRHAAEARFRFLGLTAIALAITFLFVLIGAITFKGYSAFTKTYIALDVTIEKKGEHKTNYRGAARQAVRDYFPNVSERRDKRQLYKLFSPGIEFEIRDYLSDHKHTTGPVDSIWSGTIWVSAAADIDMLNKGYIDRKLPQSERKVIDKQLVWYDKLVADGRVERRFNTTFFTAADSREPEQAGILGAVVGSAMTLLVTLALVFPIGVASAVYLEEFAPRNRWTDLIEVNINNLAAVPSIVFGLLGLAVILNFFELPRSAPLAGGIVLALMTMPTVIIAGRSALMSVPPSIREAALGVGASQVQTIVHHVLPLAMPGMLTGAIIGMARALGETAPLLMIGMVAFIVDIPESIVDAATVLPVQIFLWADAPERAFLEKTSAATIILLVFLAVMNLAAILLRKKFERRW